MNDVTWQSSSLLLKEKWEITSLIALAHNDKFVHFLDFFGINYYICST